MKHLDLFSGIGGFSLAAQWVWGDEHEIVAFCEIDKFCQKVLHKHWPDVPIIADIKDVTYERIMAYTESKRQRSGIQGEQHQLERSKKRRDITQCCKTSKNRRTTIDLLTGGFPCQPFSVAGKRRGAEDDRAIWPEMFRVIAEVKPTWVVAENVAGIIRMELDNCLSDLEAEGYTCWTFVLPACAVDAKHRRDRVFFVGNNTEKRIQGYRAGWQQESRSYVESGLSLRSSQDVADTDRFNGDSPRYGTSENGGKQRQKAEIQGLSTWLPESGLGRVAHGVSNRVDRLKSLGNAIVPQVVVPIMKAIKTLTI